MSDEFIPGPIDPDDAEAFLKARQSFQEREEEVLESGTMAEGAEKLSRKPAPTPLNDPNLTRITTVLQVYQERQGDPPVEIDSRFSEIANVLEESFVRAFRIDENDGALPLDLGWCPRPCLLVIQNLRPFHPTQVEKEVKDDEDKRRVVIDDLWEIPVGADMKAYLMDDERVPSIRCLCGVARIRVHAIPRG